jgi:Ca-activated chloride channel family protein
MKKNSLLTILLSSTSILTLAQTTEIREGNKFYKEGNYDAALEAYNKAVKKNPDDLTAMYNRSNALAKKGDRNAAMEGYDQLLSEAKDPKILEQAFYDKGVLHQQQQQLDESIEAWKSALKLDPEDRLARENLQKALKEKKKQEEEKEKKKEQEQPKDKKENQPPKPQPEQSKLNQKQVEQLLKALEQKEKEVQKKMQQKSASSSRPEKDW